ncbi:ABC transporter ATP-binding protein [Alphaproteobacteria bacterium]|nr:ABC transporter ATP-binding protein [Alphaproteobacteria bacterium]
MIKLLKQSFTLLTKGQRKRFYTLQFLVVLMAFSEIIGVASIIPFMSLVGDMGQLQRDTIIAQVYKESGINTETQFIFLLGVGVLFILFISTIISMLTTWRLSMFGNKVGAEIADRLYAYYLKQGWLFHASESSAQLTKKVAIEAQRVTNGIIMPLMQMNSRIILALFIMFTIFFYDPKVAIIGLIFFATAYSILFKVVRMRLLHNGRAISEVNEKRFRLMNEGFGGIKDVLLLGRANNFVKDFKQTGHLLAYSQGTNVALSQVPSYLMQFLAFGSMIALLLYLIAGHDGNLGVILPIISVYALAGFKLLPAFQQIYASVAGIRGNIAAFQSIQKELSESTRAKSLTLKPERSYLHLKQQISLENITFTYPGKVEPTLKQLNMSIPANSIIGIVGPSGAGKSTLIDILLGLIEPKQGHLKIDNIIINDKNRRSWQNTIGFVAQSIFLSEGTIAENVAFGIAQDQIDLDQVKKVLKLTYLTELIQNLEQGIHTKVGERGVQLSGGQRQRIGIARALYHQAEVLVFDEATSSLDGITEKIIMESINNFRGQKTIILIAHRIKTVQKCDQIFFIDKKKLVDQGTYKQLIKRNEHFRKIASHA